MEGFRTIASALTVKEPESGVADVAAGVIRRVGVSLVRFWREEYWKNFEQKLVRVLDGWIPGYADPRRNGAYKRIAKQSRTEFQEALRSEEVKVLLLLATYERVRLAQPSLPDPSEEAIVETKAALAPYIV